MHSWTCPNTKRTYDKRLQPRPHCPLCGEQAKEFNFNELGDLWKQKWDYKKSIERAKKQERVSGRRKYCPKCDVSLKCPEKAKLTVYCLEDAFKKA